MRVANALTAAMSGHTQKAVAASTGIDQGRISRIMRHDRGESPTLDEIARIEAAIGVPPGYVLTLAGLVTVEGARLGARAAKAAGHTGNAPS